MPNTPQLITEPDQVNPEWLTKVFKHAGYDYLVDSFEAESIGTGQVGENVRFSLKGSNNMPTSIVGKFMSPDPVSRATGIQQQTYIKEVFFYKNLQDKADIHTAGIFFAECDFETHEFVIMMEDLAPGQQGDQISGCTTDDAALALEELGKLHGPYWGDRSLMSNIVFSQASESEKIAQLQMIYRMVLPGFLDRYSARLSSEHIAIIEQMPDLLPNYRNFYRGQDTLIHSDYRLDNMMFGGAQPLTVVDWQTISLGCGLVDASYFLGTSLSSEIRIKQETDLLKHYHDVLRSYKVDLNWNDCFRNYRGHASSGFIMAVIASMVVSETERGNDMFIAMAKRSCQQVIELECFELLRSS